MSHVEIQSRHRFNRIAWGQVHRDRSRGVIAAGMENGELALWDPAKIIGHAEFVILIYSMRCCRLPRRFSSISESLILRNTIHTGPVRGLDFNPIQTNLLSSGAVNGEVSTQRFFDTRHHVHLHVTSSRNASAYSTGLYMGSQ